MLVDVEDLREEILRLYGTQHTFAKKIGYAETQLPRAIQTQSPKFILACKKAGINIDELVRKKTNRKEKQTAGKNDKRIMELEQLVHDQKELIEIMREIIRNGNIKNKE